MIIKKLKDFNEGFATFLFKGVNYGDQKIPNTIVDKDRKFIYSEKLNKFFSVYEIQDIFREYINWTKVNGIDPIVNDYTEIDTAILDKILSK